MITNSYSITQEPEADVYCKLLQYALIPCSLASVVVRPDLPLTSHGNQLLEELSPFLQEKVISNEWPGTQLVEGNAVVHYFAYDKRSVDILLKHSTRLYQWVQPDLPEDLGLLRSLEKPWLVSIGHEKDSYLLMDEAEMTDFVKVIPEIQSITKRDMPTV